MRELIDYHVITDGKAQLQTGTNKFRLKELYQIPEDLINSNPLQPIVITVTYFTSLPYAHCTIH